MTHQYKKLPGDNENVDAVLRHALVITELEIGWNWLKYTAYFDPLILYMQYQPHSNSDSTPPTPTQGIWVRGVEGWMRM